MNTHPLLSRFVIPTFWRLACLVVGLSMVSQVVFDSQVVAQEYDFGVYPDSGGGHATAEIDITINGQELSAVIRNTSPDQSNFGSGLLSPSIFGFGFDLVGDAGQSLTLEDWSLTASNQDSTNSYNLTRNHKPKWTTSQSGDSFEFEADKNRYGLYNPDATGGLKGGLKVKYTEATFWARFDGSVNLVESLAETFSPLVRFGYVGSAMKPIELATYGTLRSYPGGGNSGGGHINPEPSSMLVWAMGLVTYVGVKRKRRARV